MSETMSGLKRTGYCADFSAKDIESEIVVCGWVARRRSLGGIIFIDLRDRTGILQLAFDDSTDKAVFEKAEQVRSEYVLAAKGVVRRRDSINSKLATGEIELAVTELRILAKSETPPFEIAEDTDVRDELLLKYRYLDLRRPDMQKSIILRHKITQIAHGYFAKNGFIEIETPILIKSTPEGARDYLVPSRVHAGSFYALPQSPQLYKQLLMLSGFDKYMQIARCFRDEDLRADRQPEFTQIDIEMSFVDMEDIIEVNEGFIKRVFKEALNRDVTTPFVRLSYEKAMELYGSDKPDTRFGLMLTDISDIAANSGFKVFDAAVSGGGSVRAINVKGGFEKLTRKELDKLALFAKDYGVGGLAWSRLSGETTSSSFAKFLSAEKMVEIYKKLDATDGDVVLVVSDTDNDVVFSALGALRLKVAAKFDLIPQDSFNLLWVTEFPLFEYDKKENRYSAKHHPFTAPADEDIERLETEPRLCHAKAFDIVLNGVELGGGSIRINDQELQQRMFALLGHTKEQAEERFGFLTNAFRYGAPPHGGMAYGLDRLVMLLLGRSSIRDVIAFPKVQNASELMTACPMQVEKKQLEELHISVML